MAYIIYNNYGVPQCGCETITCETWDEVAEYFCDERNLNLLQNGYASYEEVADHSDREFERAAEQAFESRYNDCYGDY